MPDSAKGVHKNSKNTRIFYGVALNARFFVFAFLTSLLVLGNLFVDNFFSISSAQAAEGINRTINYQGRLMNTAGTNVADGNYDIKFTIYDSASGGTQLWTASSTNGLPTGSIASVSVSVEGGLFSILLGDTSDNQVAFPDDMFNSDSLYLGITIGTDAEMTPRKRLSSVPYAFNSETLQGQYASNTVANTGGDLFALHQNSTDAASATRTALYVETNGTDDENDLLINASNGSTDVFTINRQGNVTTTGNLEVDGITQLNNTLAVSATSSLSDLSLSGRVDSNLLPYITDTYYLGNSTYRWLGLTVGNVSSTNIDALNYVSTTNLYVGGVQVTGATPNLQHVTDVNNITTNAIGVAGVSSTGNILPTTSLTYDLGSSSNRWDELWVSSTHIGGSTWDLSQNANGYFSISENGGSERMTIDTSGNVGIGDTSPVAMFTVGNGDLFQVSSTGNLAKIRGVDFSWPSSQGGANTFLKNDGSGTLTWATVAGASTPSWAEVTLVGATSSEWISFYGATSTGSIVAGVNNQYDIGTFGNAWNDVYASGTVYGSALSITPDSGTMEVVTSTSLASAGSLHGMEIVGDYAYISDLNSGDFIIEDISNPLSPKTVGSLDTGYSALGAIQVMGDYAYVNALDRLIVIDISSSTAPSIVGTSAAVTDTNYSYDLYVKGNYVYFPDLQHSALEIIKVSDPTNPIVVKTVGTSNQVQTLTGNGDYIYTVPEQTANDPISIINVSDPENAYLVGTINNDVVNYPTDMAVSGNNLYVHSGRELSVLDISDPANPVKKDSVVYPAPADSAASRRPQSIIATDGYVYTFTNDDLVVVDVRDQDNIFIAAQKYLGATLWTLDVQGKYAYSIDSSRNLKIVDLGGIETHSLNAYSAYLSNLGVSGLANFAEDTNIGGKLSVSTDGIYNQGQLDVVGASLFLSTSTNSDITPITNNTYSLGTLGNAWKDLYSYNISTNNISTTPNSSVISVVTSTSFGSAGTPKGIDIVGNYAYISDIEVAGGFKIVDISIPSSPTTTGYVATGYGLLGTVKVLGDYAYVNANDQFIVIDVSDKTNPVVVGASPVLTNTNYIYGLYVKGNYVYFPDIQNTQIDIVDVSDPTNPTFVKSVAAYAHTIGGFGNYIYTTTQQSSPQRMSVIDISDPENAYVVTTYNLSMTGTWPVSIAAFEDHVYVHGQNKLEVINVNDPANPITEDLISTTAGIAGLVQSIIATRDYVYTISNSGIIILDVSDPTNVFTKAEKNLASTMYGLDVQGNFAYTIDSNRNLSIFNLGGIETHSINAYSGFFSNVTISGVTNLVDDVAIGGKMTVGTDGIYNQGSLDVLGTMKVYGTSTMSNILPHTDSAYDLGSSSSYWRNLYADTVNTYALNLTPGAGTVLSRMNIDNNGGTSAVEIVGNFMYVGIDDANGNYGKSGEDFQIFDISDPEYPQYLGGINFSTGRVYGIKVIGNYAYLAGIDLDIPSGDLDRSFVVVDISDPYNPTALWGQNFDNSGYGRQATNFEVADNYLYVADYEIDSSGNDIRVYDISVPSLPVFVGGFNPGARVYEMSLMNDKYMAIATDDSSYSAEDVLLIDISDPSNIAYVDGVQIGTNPIYGLKTDGTKIYAVTQTGSSISSREFAIIDASSSTNMSVTGSFDLSNVAAKGIALAGNYAYILQDDGYGSNEVSILDISSSTSPTYVAGNNFGAFSIANQIVISGGTMAIAMDDDASGYDVYLVDIDGLKTHTASIGNLTTDLFTVTGNGKIGNNLFVKNDIYSESITANSDIVSGGGLFAQATSSMATILPNSNNLYDLGGDGYAWRNIYASGTAYLSNIWNQTLDSSNPTSNTFTTESETTHGGNGFYGAIDIAGNYLYTGSLDGNELEIFDVSVPSAPSSTGVVNIGYPIYGLKISGKYAYASYYYNFGNDGFKIIDISNPSSPTVVATMAVAGAWSGIDVAGSYLYQTNNDNNSLQIYDISNPTAPVLVNSTSSYGTNPRDVFIQGNVAYVTNYSSAILTTYDITDPINPSFIATSSVATAPISIHVQGRYAYIAHVNSTINFSIVDISDPANATQIATLNTGTYPTDSNNHSIYAVGRYVYLAGYSGSDAIRMIDVQDPYNPKVVATKSRSNVSGVVVNGRYVYAPYYNGGLGIYKTSGIETNAIQAHTAEISDISILGNANINNELNVQGALTVADGILSSGPFAVSATSTFHTIVPFSDNTYDLGTSAYRWRNLYLSGTAYLPSIATDHFIQGFITPEYISGVNYDDGNAAYAMDIQGNYTYIAEYGDLYIIDHSDKDNPKLITNIVTPSYNAIYDIKVSGDYIYTAGADSGRELMIYNISDISTPVLSSTINLAATGRTLELMGQYAYLGMDNGDIAIVNILDPSSPVLVNTLDLGSSSITSIKKYGSLVYVGTLNGDTDKEMVILDASDPKNPTVLGGADIGTTTVRDIYPDGRYAYVATLNGNAGTDDLLVYDVSDPTTPVYVDGIDIDSDQPVNNIQAFDHYLYLTSLNSSVYSNRDLIILDVSSSTNITYVGSKEIDGSEIPDLAIIGNYVHVLGYQMDISGFNADYVILKIGDVDLYSADIESLNTGTLWVDNSAKIADQLFVGTSINVGSGGLMTNGGIYVSATSTMSNIMPISNNTYDLGGEGYSWRNIYASSSVVTERLWSKDITQGYMAPQYASGVDYAISNDAFSMDVQGNYTYIGQNYNFFIMDHSDKNNPKLIDTIHTPSYNRMYDVKVNGEYAYFATEDTTRTLEIYNISDPSASVYLSGLNLGSVGRSLELMGQYAYVGMDNGDIAIVNIMNPASPTLENTLDLGSNPIISIKKYGSLVYVGTLDGDTDKEMVILDASDPKNPTVLGGADIGTTTVRDIYPDGRYAYVATLNGNAGTDDLLVYDVSDPTTPVYVDGIDIDSDQPVDNIQAFDHYLYLTSFNSSVYSNRDLITLDISSSTNITYIGSIEIDGSELRGLILEGNYAHVLGYQIDISGFNADYVILKIGDVDLYSADIESLNTGTLWVDNSAKIADQLFVGTGLNVGRGGLATTGGLFAQSTSTFADLSTTGRVNSNLLPYITDTYYLGNNAYKWRGISVTNVSSTNIDALGYVSTTVLYLNGAEFLGDLQSVTDINNITDNAVGVAGVSSTGDILPTTSLNYNLGSISNRWSDIWGATFHVGTSTWDMTQLADGSFDVNQASTSLNLSRGVSGDDASLAVKSATIGVSVLRLADEDDQDYAYFAANSSGAGIMGARNFDFKFGTSNFDRLVLESDGDLRPNSNNVYDLGTATYAWKNFYLSSTAYFGGVGDASLSFATSAVMTVNPGSYPAFTLYPTSAAESLFFLGDESLNPAFFVKDATHASFAADWNNDFALNVGGNVGPAVNNSYDLGSGSYSWRNIYVSGTTAFNNVEYTWPGSSSNGILRNTNGTLSWDTDAYLTSANAFIQDGNSFTANAILGTNDSFSLSFETGGTSRATIGTDGRLTMLGSANTVQLAVRANASQTNANPLFRLETSGGAELARVHSDDPSNIFVGYQAGLNNSIGNGLSNTFFGASAGRANTNGDANVAIGHYALDANQGGSNNVAVGFNALTTNIGNSGNIGIGYNALQLANGADDLIGIGQFALSSNSTGAKNIGIGRSANYYNTTGNNNVAIGYATMQGSGGNYARSNNTAVGYYSMLDIQTGQDNSSLGVSSLENVTTGSVNTSLGSGSMLSLTTGSSNTAVGYNALYSNQSGFWNVAVGDEALKNSGTGILANIAIGHRALYNQNENASIAIGAEAQFSSTGGYANLSIGNSSLRSNITGDRLIAIGEVSLYNNTASDNMAVGYEALHDNTSGTYNTGIGLNAGLYNQTGSKNTSLGHEALRGASIGGTSNSSNTAIGYRALFGISSGNNNTAVGHQALFTNTTGYDNTALGTDALHSLTTGNSNIGLGKDSLFNSIDDFANVAIGYESLYNITNNQNVGVGYQALYNTGNSAGNVAVGGNAGNAYDNGSFNTFVGYNSDSAGAGYTNTMALGYGSIAPGSNQIRIGNTSVTNIYAQVGITPTSDIRMKDNITDNQLGLNYITKLHPVHFTWKDSPDTRIQDGLIAQDLAVIEDDMGISTTILDDVAYNNTSGTAMYGIRYDLLTIPLINATKEIYASSSPLWSGIAIDSNFATSSPFLWVDEDGNITTKEVVVAQQEQATTSTPAVNSYTFSFNGSAWNPDSNQEISTSFRMFNNTISATSSELKYVYTTGTGFTQDLLTISNMGDMKVSGDLYVGKRLFLGSKSTGLTSTSTYIFVDDTLAPTSTYIATNADGWQANTSYDYAERYKSNEELQPGDLVVVDSNETNLVKRSNSSDEIILGIVSTKPGFMTGGPEPNTYPIALAGRVPTKVSNVKGKIEAGDFLAPSDIPGVAVKATEKGSYIGIALESFDEDQGLISVFVNVGYMGNKFADLDINQSQLNDIKGFAYIKSGSTEVIVKHQSLLAYPLIQIMPYGGIKGNYWVQDITGDSFTIMLSEAQNFDLKLGYSISVPNTDQVPVSDGTTVGFDTLTGEVLLPPEPVVEEVVPEVSVEPSGDSVSPEPVIEDTVSLENTTSTSG